MWLHLESKPDWVKNTESVHKKGQRLFSAEAPVIQCLQHNVDDVLPVCGSQCYFLCCLVLGQQTQQAHQEDWLRPGGGAWYFGGGVREEDAAQTAEHHGQWLSPLLLFCTLLKIFISL